MPCCKAEPCGEGAVGNLQRLPRLSGLLRCGCAIFLHHAAETLLRLYEAVISPLMEHVGIVLQEDAESPQADVAHTRPFSPKQRLLQR